MIRYVRFSIERLFDADRAIQGPIPVLQVDPADIQHVAATEFSYEIFQSAVIDGDWDQSTKTL